jgi:alpha-tubulin suppressor-like RCC1 family protein
MWTLDTVLEYEKAGAWPKPVLPRELYAWGLNGNGQVGDGTVINRSSPVQVGALTDWKQISSFTHTVSVKTDGTLWAWGYNTVGTVGDNTTVDKSSPVQVGSLTNWYQVSAGRSHSLAVKTDSTLWSWGDSNRGELGIGLSPARRSSPVQVGVLTNWNQISAGYEISASVKTDGTLWTWGYNDNGQLGDGTIIQRNSPVQIGSLNNWYQVAAGWQFMTAVKTDGTLWAWGRASVGRLGDNQTTANRSSPVQIGSLTNWAYVSNAGNIVNGNALAVKTDGTLWGWGYNGGGQLGDGTVVSRSSPVQIGALTNWLRASGGVGSSVAIRTDGTLWTWGLASLGRLGDNTAVNKSSPVQIGALTNWGSVGLVKGLSIFALTKG